jgi:dolichyl-phosphate-mannose--protein O-mannosyl transferase
MWQKKLIWVVPLAGLMVALGMHWWNLGTPARFIGDEHYFVKDARAELNHQPYLDAHPPLGKLELAAMIKIFGDQPFNWRALNAVLGALIVPMIWLIAWWLSRSQVVAALAMLFALTDGFLLVESRSAMINVPYLAYALGALVAVLAALRRRQYLGWLGLAGLLGGLAVSVKWLALLLLIPALIVWIWPAWFGLAEKRDPDRARRWWTIICLGLVPTAVYILVWQIHFALTGMPTQTVMTNLYLFWYHSHGNIGNIYHQIWWQWPLLTQPFPYSINIIGEKISSIWAMGNPWVWWTGTVALGWGFIWGWRNKTIRLLNVFLLATWLPFSLIKRDMFLYHATPFGCFLFILLAIVGGQLWAQHRKLVVGYMAMTVIVFVWFLPWYMNLPLTKTANEWRRWLPTWQANSLIKMKAAADETRLPSE